MIIKRVPFLAFLALAACSGVKISGVDRDPAFNISNYKSFGFHEIEAGGDALAADIRPNLEIMKNAIAKQLEARGLTRTQANPDLAVNIGVAVSTEAQTRETSFSNPGDRHMAYMGQRTYSWQSTEVVVGHYKDGSMKVDLVDRSANKLVWTGTAESVVPEKQKNVPAVIEDAVQRLLEKL
jgi:hypothetical protein